MGFWLALLSLLIPSALDVLQIDPLHPPCLLDQLPKVPDWRLSTPAAFNQSTLEQLAPYAPVYSSTADIIWWWCFQGLATYSSGGPTTLCAYLYVDIALDPFWSQKPLLLESVGLRHSLQHWLQESADRCRVCLPGVPPWVLPPSSTCHWADALPLPGTLTPPAASTTLPSFVQSTTTCPVPTPAGIAAGAAQTGGDILCPAVDWDWPWKALLGLCFGVVCVVMCAIASGVRLLLLAAAGAVYVWGTAATHLVSSWGSFPGRDQGSLAHRAGVYVRGALLAAWGNLCTYLAWCLVHYLVPEVLVSLVCLLLLVTGSVDPISLLLKHFLTTSIVTLGLAKARFGGRLFGVLWWAGVVVGRPAAAVTRPVWGPVVTLLAPVVTPPAAAAWHWVTAHVVRGPVLTICIELQRSLSWAAGGEEGQDVWQDAIEAAADEDPDDDLGEDLAAEDGQLLEAYGEALQRDVPDWPHGDRDQSTVTCRVCGCTPLGPAAGADAGGMGLKQDKFLVCAQCHSPHDSYCSTACMEQDWPRHRRNCQPPLVWTESL